MLLLFRDTNTYRHTLGVTFTNKASDEMKSRILGVLSSLKTGDEKDYTPSLMKNLGISKAKLVEKADYLLAKILHDYSGFTIQTIDKFFQTVLKSFARDIGLYSGYQIELDQNKILTEIVDQMILQFSSDKRLKSWMIRYVEEKMKEGKSWNLEKELIELGEEMFKERYMKNFVNGEKEHEFESVDKSLDIVHQVISQTDVLFKEVGEKTQKYLDDYGLTIQDFKRPNSSVPAYLLRLAKNNKDPYPSDTVRKNAYLPEEWYKKNPKELIPKIESIYHEKLFPLCMEAFQLCRKYASAEKVKNNLYAMGVLSEIRGRMSVYLKEKNLMLLSSGNELLHEIIDGNDIPFVYERTGNRFHHFLIDEFQDTSDLQWENFKPLIAESLGSGNENLVVGDVKQSIYRWRNGDWRILANKIHQDFSHLGSIQSIDLDNNWRSLGNIISFNNAFFARAQNTLKNFLLNRAEMESPEIKNYISDLLDVAYSGLVQNNPQQKDGGYVACRFIEKEGDVFQSRMDHLTEDLEKLFSKNFKAGDIAILVRNGKEAKEIAGFLTENTPYPVVSADSFLISNAPVVRIIILIFRFLLNPDDELGRGKLIWEYLNYSDQQDKLGDLHKNNHQPFKEAAFFEILPDLFSERFPDMKLLSMESLLDEIILIFDLHKSPANYIYLQAFQDMVRSYCSGEKGDLAAFMDFWEQTGIEKSISVSSNEKAINISTIHKSKGLEYKAVIIPYCDWDLDGKTNAIFWCKSKEKPFDQLGLVPVKYSSKLLNTAFAEDYAEELMSSNIDNLNLLYVAFTRAKEVLISYSLKRKETSKGQKNVGDLVFDSVQSKLSKFENRDLMSFDSCLNDDGFSFGEIPEQKNGHSSNDVRELNIYPVFIKPKKLRIYSRMNEYMESHNPVLSMGLRLHEMFSEIKDQNDVLPVLDKHLKNDDIDMEHYQKLKLAFDNPKVKGWYLPGLSILSERDILLPDGQKKRPDRLIMKKHVITVVDFKFGREKDAYFKQIREYMQIMSDIENKEVEAFLWYPLENKIIEVTAQE